MAGITYRLLAAAGLSLPTEAQGQDWSENLPLCTLHLRPPDQLILALLGDFALDVVVICRSPEPRHGCNKRKAMCLGPGNQHITTARGFNLITLPPSQAGRL
jgi:hypothetical protein